MNQKELLQKIVEKTNFTHNEAKKFLEAFKETISIHVSEEDIKIYKFGRFYLHRSKERKGRNPKTGESVMIPARFTVKFKASRNL